MAKALLKSSDKSNFILNMTEGTYSKLAAIGLFAACFTVPLFTVFPELNDEHTYSIASIGMAISGVFCLITALIAIVKKYVRKEALIPVIAFAVLIGWSVVSLCNSYDVNVSFYGYPQRNEGLLSTLYYFGFFVTALSIKREKAVKSLVYGIIGSGLLNSAWALLQIFTENHKYSHYSMISIIFDFAASGLSHSPFFLAVLLMMSLTAALVTAVSCNSNKVRVFCVISSFIFGFVLIFTYIRLGYIALAAAAAACIAAVFISKAPKIRLLVLIAPAMAVGIAFLAMRMPSVAIFKYRLHDGMILWTGDSYERLGSSGLYDARTVDIDNNSDVYHYINDKTFDIIKKYPLTGTGPEQLLYPQIHTFRNEMGVEMDLWEDRISVNYGTFDKTYNEYLYIGATRGIPAMAALLVLVGSTVWLGIKRLKKRRTPSGICIFMVTAVGFIGLFFCCSSIAFAPLLWAAAGASCAEPDAVEEEKNIGSKSDEKKETEKE